jgi:hypothetical protein
MLPDLLEHDLKIHERSRIRNQQHLDTLLFLKTCKDSDTMCSALNFTHPIAAAMVAMIDRHGSCP